VEEHFYLVWPLIVWLTPPKKLLAAALAIIALAVGLRAAFIAGGIKVYYFTFTRMDLLAAGAVLACMEASAGTLASWKNVLRSGAMLTAIAGILGWMILPATILENGNISYA